MPASITCPRCGRTSYNANDVREGYCGHCHDWTRADTPESVATKARAARGIVDRLIAIQDRPLYYVWNREMRQATPATVEQWAIHFETADRQIAHDVIEPSGREISTVFLGIDHAIADGPPILFETMIFPPASRSGIWQCRHATIDDAERVHRELVDDARDGQWPDDMDTET